MPTPAAPSPCRRHGCAPAYPSWAELQFFLERGVKTPALRHDAELEQIHWATNRKGDWSTMRVFAFDHRSQLEDMADAANVSHPHIGAFKKLCLEAAIRLLRASPAMASCVTAAWAAMRCTRRSIRGCGSGGPRNCPARARWSWNPRSGRIAAVLNEWPLSHVVKVLCFCHPDDHPALWNQQEQTVLRLFTAARRNRLEFLLEVIPSKFGKVTDDTTATVIQRFYDVGVTPDWWKLEPFKTDAAWENACAAITRNDPNTRGIVVLGLDAPADELAASFALAAKQPLVKGFAVGRTIFGEVAPRWFAGDLSSEDAVAEMATRYENLCRVWDTARAAAKGKAA